MCVILIEWYNISLRGAFKAPLFLPHNLLSSILVIAIAVFATIYPSQKNQSLPIQGHVFCF